MIPSLLANLNPEQQEAVQSVDGPVLVLAGPGSGKTRVLTHRVAFLIDHAGIDPMSILCVTFTNKAAREMKERLLDLLGPERAHLPAIGTFHSLCARFLRRDIVYLGRDRDFVIYDSDDQARLIRGTLRELNIDDKKFSPMAVLTHISGAKNELVSPQEYARTARSYFDEVVVRVYERYQAALIQNNALDFDDLMGETVRLFKTQPDVLAKYHDRFSHLLVDEYQDTNFVQYTLVKMLASRRRNLFAVGDHDQSIFGWRGADTRNITRFEQDYPEARVIALEQNYRSTQSVLDVAQAVITRSPQRRFDKKLWTDNGQGTPVTVIESYDPNDEAQCIAGEISRLMGREGYRLSDCAVLYRMNAQSRSLEEAFLTHGLRYRIVGGVRFYERKEIKDVLAYLRVCTNPSDSISLARILNVPQRGIGDRTEEEIARWAAANSITFYRALRDIADNEPTPPRPNLPTRTRNALREFVRLLDILSEAAQKTELPFLLDIIYERLSFRESLRREFGPEEGEERWANLVELRAVAEEFSAMPQEAQLSTFLQEATLVNDVDELEADADAITCITLHQAKGLEYPIVFLVGLEEGVLPHSRSIDDRDQLEEERRLLYVGITRAKQRLYMLYCTRRTMWGKTSMSAPSRFLADIPANMLKAVARRSIASAPTGRGATPTPQRREVNGYTTAGRSTSAEQPRRAPLESRTSASQTQRMSLAPGFAPGQRVKHHLFGEGIVVTSRLIENDEEVTVMFAERGQKRLLASFARLERLEG